MIKFVTVFTIILCLAFHQNVNAQYDSVMAKKLNADEYGMKSYVLVILKKGTVSITDKNLRDSIFRGHMANIQRLANEGKLIVAGPTGENAKNYEGIFVYNTADTTEARQWLNTDPAIQSKDIDAEIYTWYSSASLQEIPALHKTVQKKSF